MQYLRWVCTTLIFIPIYSLSNHFTTLLLKQEVTKWKHTNTYPFIVVIGFKYYDHSLLIRPFALNKKGLKTLKVSLGGSKGHYIYSVDYSHSWTSSNASNDIILLLITWIPCLSLSYINHHEIHCLFFNFVFMSFPTYRVFNCCFGSSYHWFGTFSNKK